jgi:putative ABC transport system permease protein
MKIIPLKGRWFDETDLGKAVQPVIVSKDIEKKYYNENALGKRVERDNKYFEIIGVVDRFKRIDIESPDPFIFTLKDSVKAKQNWVTDILIRTKENKMGDMLAVAENQVYSTLNPESWTIGSLNSLENMKDKINVENYQRNYLTIIIALFIMVNVFLGTIGILWYNTNLRIHEIGIKRALGSTGKGIKRLLITENFVIAGAGLLLVVIIILQIPIFVNSEILEPGVKGISIWISTIMMALLVFLSTWLPATIASKISPAIALKTE